MRILVHDYAAHPFPVELSRELAGRGHSVLHAYCASLRTGPSGTFDLRSDDPESLAMQGITLDSPLDKFSFYRRYRQENQYGDLITAVAAEFQPDVVLSGNTPLDAQRKLWSMCQSKGVKTVFWLQDLIGLASHRILSKKIPLLGSLVGKHYVRIEKSLLRSSDQVVCISDDFIPILTNWNVDESRINVIENWAPLDDITVVPKDNRWSSAHNYTDKFIFMYTGTMGMKHNPELIAALARHFDDDAEVRIVVASQGLGSDWLREENARRPFGNLDLMDFHPFEDLSVALGSADVLVAVLEKDADVYSVPSKVLAYLSAGRPVLLAVPSRNLAARIVTTTAAGLAVEPDDIQRFTSAARKLYENDETRATMGINARDYAESHFNISLIGDAFEEVLVS